MIKRIALSGVALVFATASMFAATGYAQAQQSDGRWDHHRDDGRGPPPPPRDRHHHHGGAIAGGVAAGLIGGIIGGAIANGGGGYAPPPPPPPRCWREDRQVANAYDGGWHYESVRVCR